MMIVPVRSTPERQAPAPHIRLHFQCARCPVSSPNLAELLTHIAMKHKEAGNLQWQPS